MAGDKHDHHGRGQAEKKVKTGAPHFGHSRRPDAPGQKKIQQEKHTASKQQELLDTKPLEKSEAVTNTEADETHNGNGVTREEDGEDTVLKTGEERVLLASADDDRQSQASDVSHDPTPGTVVEEDNNINNFARTQDEDFEETMILHSNPDNFDIRSFNSSISDFVELFSNPRLQEVDADYPVDDLISVVSTVSTSIEEFKSYTSTSQRQLEELRKKMKTVKENIHLTVTRQAFEITPDDAYQTVEEKELTEKLAKLNAAVAKANSEVAEAVRLSAETESTAVKAQISADRAKEEAKRIQEEIELRAQKEAQKRAEEQRRMDEERKRAEEEERKAEEERRAKEAEWRRREASNVDRTNPWEKWPVHEYTSRDTNTDTVVDCVVRGHPAKFEKDHIRYEVIDQQHVDVTFGSYEELISHVIKLSSPSGGNNHLQEPLYVAIPHVMTRAAAVSREAVVKAEIDGKWEELPTREVTLENHKDLKFAQAEVRTLTTLLVMSRFKRDFVTLTRKATKITSSVDQRITFTVPRDTFKGKEHLLLQIQSVDSASVHDFRTRDIKGKGLLTSSPIVHMEWESHDLVKPMAVTLPCPPNPAKARKLAQIRKMKEEKMKAPKPKVMTIEEAEKIKEKEKKKQLQLMEQEERTGQQSRWYMGEYGATDDDENDLLYFLSYSHGKWTVVPDMEIIQAKLDLVTFDLARACDRFMVIRTRTNVDEEGMTMVASGFNDYLSKRYVQVILKQRSDDPFEVGLYVVPITRVERTLKFLSDDGYDEGPSPSNVFSISEGDVMEIGFRGNVQSTDSQTLELHFNSNVTSKIYFTVTEVDKYLQKNFQLFRGVVQLFRKYTVITPEVKSLTRKVPDDELSSEPEVRRDWLCDLLINIPKYNVEPSTIPVKAPIVIHNTRDPVNEEYMHRLAAELGDEWRRVAHYLDVQRVRIQAILRNMQIGDRSDEDAKFDMLMTWLKRAPKSADKVTILSVALSKSGRADLADQVRMREREFREQQISSR